MLENYQDKDKERVWGGLAGRDNDSFDSFNPNSLDSLFMKVTFEQRL